MQSLPEDVPKLNMKNILSLYSEKDQNKFLDDTPKKSMDIEKVSSRKLLPCKHEATAQDSAKSLLSIGAFTIQCSRCLQWRLIPSKEKYEEIRESILQKPFHCENAREWHPNASCSDPADTSPGKGRLWAIDKPNIPRSPPGWQRVLKFRGEGGTRFADVHYVSPTGKKLRSKVEVEKYLLENPDNEHLGINSSKFSFQTPRPLQENYVRKKIPSSENPHESLGLAVIDHAEDDNLGSLGTFQMPTPAITWAGDMASYTRTQASGSTSK